MACDILQSAGTERLKARRGRESSISPAKKSLTSAPIEVSDCLTINDMGVMEKR